MKYITTTALIILTSTLRSTCSTLNSIPLIPLLGTRVLTFGTGAHKHIHRHVCSSLLCISMKLHLSRHSYISGNTNLETIPPCSPLLLPRLLQACSIRTLLPGTADCMQKECQDVSTQQCPQRTYTCSSPLHSQWAMHIKNEPVAI